MEKRIKEYFETLKDLFGRVIATDVNGRTCALEEIIAKSIQMITKSALSGGKVLFIGNGGSASIASHMAVDFWKNAGIKALAFNDSSLLTCVSNDCGYSRVFEKPIEMFAETGDVLVAISSSGKSENILRGVKAARGKGAGVITFSGFNKNNPLRKLGILNFYVPISQYGHVELAHLALCHSVVDIFMQSKSALTKKIKSHE